MTTKRYITCDGCGVALVDDLKNDRASVVTGQFEAEQGIDLHMLFTHTETELNHGGYLWRSAGWDFCMDCGRKAVEAVSGIGPPNHTNLFADDA